MNKRIKNNNLEPEVFEKFSEYNIMMYLSEYNRVTYNSEKPLEKYNNINEYDKKKYNFLINHLQLEIIITKKLNDYLNNPPNNIAVSQFTESIRSYLQQTPIANFTPSLKSKYFIILFLKSVKKTLK